MNIVWLSWKDRGHPLAGGAESVSGNIIDHLVKDGHKVKLITATYPSAPSRDTDSGFEIIRVGGRYSVYSNARRYYKRHNLQDWADMVVDEMNTIPFLSPLYTNKPSLLLCYQLAREVWLYQMPAPFSYVGYLTEPFMLKFMSHKYHAVATESNSTKNDMLRYGFRNINTFRVGMHLKPIKRLEPKEDKKLILCLGSIRPMKRTLDAIKAFEIARDDDKNLHMIVAGDDSGMYAKKVRTYVEHSRHNEAINITGRVSAKERLNIMRRAGVILVTSIKEGWGLIVTEANSQGTPAIVYDVDGLRDSVQNKSTGVVVRNNDPEAMSRAILSLLSSDIYEKYRTKAWQLSKEFTLENSYKDFKEIISKYVS